MSKRYFCFYLFLFFPNSFLIKKQTNTEINQFFSTAQVKIYKINKWVFLEKFSFYSQWEFLTFFTHTCIGGFGLLPGESLHHIHIYIHICMCRWIFNSKYYFVSFCYRCSIITILNLIWCDFLYTQRILFNKNNATDTTGFYSSFFFLCNLLHERKNLFIAVVSILDIFVFANFLRN